MPRRPRWSSCTSCAADFRSTEEIDSHHWVDGLNAVQIRERSQLSNDEVIAQLAKVGQKAVKGRFGTPLPMRYVPVPFGDPIGWKPVNYLLEVGFTRDTWAHRVDIHAVIGRPMELDSAHDGRLVADIVGEWADLHGEPFDLQLTGPAGGTFSQGRGGEQWSWTHSTSYAPWPDDFPAPA